MKTDLKALEGEVGAMVDRLSARVIVVLLDDGPVVAFRHGMSVEFVTYELARVAQRIRQEHKTVEVKR